MWNTFDYRHDLSLCGFIDYRQFLIFYEFLNGFGDSRTNLFQQGESLYIE